MHVINLIIQQTSVLVHLCSFLGPLLIDTDPCRLGTSHRSCSSGFVLTQSSHHSLASSKLLTSSHLSICSASNTNRTTCSLGATHRWWRDHQCCSLHLSAVMMLHLTGVEPLGYKSNTVVLQISSENQIQKFTFKLKPQTCISISHKIITMMIFCWTRFSSSLWTNTPHYIIITSLNVAHMAAEWNNKTL